MVRLTLGGLGNLTIYVCVCVSKKLYICKTPLRFVFFPEPIYLHFCMRPQGDTLAVTEEKKKGFYRGVPRLKSRVTD